MPDLPTITVTSAQAQRIQSAFPGGTQAEKIEAYKVWLREALRSYVIDSEQRTIIDNRNRDIDAVATSVAQDLSTI